VPRGQRDGSLRPYSRLSDNVLGRKFVHTFQICSTNQCTPYYVHPRMRKKFKLKLKPKLIYDRQSVGQSFLVSGTHLGPATNFFFQLEIFFRQLPVCYFVEPSLTRGRVCNLLYNCFWVLPEQSLLCPSPAELTTIFYCLI
jgi:hypothetical protein